ncbi:hypothetical protein PHISP_02533 [Aspergillus sp. HF37]|nr:hypothetical protein PHISP_02533 [Aspergillus sp. HF37]
MAASPASPPNNASSTSRPNGARHSKRLTLNFPINPPPPNAVSSPGSMTPVTHSYSSARQSPALPPDTSSASFDEHDDGNGLLRAIASQERKVLELREELQHAESDLAALKKQWTSSEKTRKRTEINLHAEPLLPLKSPDDHPGHRRPQSIAAPPDTPASSSSARQSRDLDRRHSMRSAVAGPAPAGSSVSANGRRVFQGSHARTLSLLSAASDSASRKPDSLDHARPDSDRIARVPRAATLPSVDRSSTTDPPFRTPDSLRKPATAVAAEDIPPQWRNSMPPPSRDALMRTGKQMASDLREGLWTFLEDIRQATVGEEGINGTETRRISSSPGAPAAVRKRDSFNSPPSANRLSVHGGGSRSSRSSASLHSSRSPNGSRRAGSGNEPSSTDIDASFWNEFGIDTPQNDGRSRTPVKDVPGSRSADHDNDADAGAGVDDWNWDHSTPQPSSQPPITSTTTTITNNSHTPSSSRSTLESKQHSPQTQASSPRTSASFGDWNPALSTIPDPSVADGIPWPAITKPFPAPKLARTASNLMDEWQRSLSPSPERKHSPERKRGSMNLNMNGTGTANRAGSPQLAKDNKKD